MRSIPFREANPSTRGRRLLHISLPFRIVHHTCGYTPSASPPQHRIEHGASIYCSLSVFFYTRLADRSDLFSFIFILQVHTHTHTYTTGLPYRLHGTIFHHALKSIAYHTHSPIEGGKKISIQTNSTWRGWRNFCCLLSFPTTVGPHSVGGDAAKPRFPIEHNPSASGSRC